MNVWERRDLPVLSALATTEDQNVRAGYLDISLAQETLGLDLTNSEIHDSILVLGEAAYVGYEIGYETGNGGLFTRLKVTGRGQQALGGGRFSPRSHPRRSRNCSNGSRMKRQRTRKRTVHARLRITSARSRPRRSRQ